MVRFADTSGPIGFVPISKRAGRSWLSLLVRVLHDAQHGPTSTLTHGYMRPLVPSPLPVPELSTQGMRAASVYRFSMHEWG